MKIKGLTLEQLESCAKEARAKLYNARPDGLGISLVIRPANSAAQDRREEDKFRPTYRAYSINRGKDRAKNAVCFHGHFRFMLACFRAGAQSIQSSWAGGKVRYVSEADLRAKAPAIGMANVGSQAFPVQARESCNCCDFSVNPEGIY